MLNVPWGAECEVRAAAGQQHDKGRRSPRHACLRTIARRSGLPGL